MFVTKFIDSSGKVVRIKPGDSMQYDSVKSSFHFTRDGRPLYSRGEDGNRAREFFYVQGLNIHQVADVMRLVATVLGLRCSFLDTQRKGDMICTFHK